MAGIRMTKNYSKALMQFCERIATDQRKVFAERTPNSPAELMVYFENGRKYDKIIVDLNDKPNVRYFVDKQTGVIYGAKSPQAPNLSWYFGTLNTAKLWTWGDHHGVPVNDESVRLVKTYGVYRHYMKVE